MGKLGNRKPRISTNQKVNATVPRAYLPKAERLKLFSVHSLRAGLATSTNVDERYIQKRHRQIDGLWDIQDLVALADANEPAPKKRGPYKKRISK